MNHLIIPPSPNWYQPDIMACAPDNTLIYGSRQDIVFIKSTPENEPDDVQIITKAHSMRIKSVNVNRNWGEPHKYAVTVSEDKVVKLWDIESLEKRLSHNKHVIQDDDSKVVGASFAGDDRVISISEYGTIVIWNIIKNETSILCSLFDAKTTVTCLSVCPHATWLAAFGLKSGLVVVADLRRSGKILYKLRGHDKAVVSLSWCPAPVNIFPVKPINKVIEKSLDKNTESIQINEEVTSGAIESNEQVQKDSDTVVVIVDSAEQSSDKTINETEEILDEPLETSKEKSDRRKQKHPKKAPHPWVGLFHADDGDATEPVQKPNSDAGTDFLKECATLRQHIIETKSPNIEVTIEETSAVQESVPAQKRVILRPKGKSQKCQLSNLLLKKEEALQSLAETSEKEDADTPTDRRVLSMEISHSVERLGGKLTNVNLKSMELKTCGREETTNTVDTILSDTDGQEESAYVTVKGSLSDSSSLDTTISSEEGKKFSSVSSCDIDCKCSKDHQGTLEQVRKSDTSSTSESGDVFHDAQVCEIKQDKGREICRVEDADEQPRKEFLLASSAREPNIYIWRAGTDGRMQSFMTVPPVKGQKKVRTDKVWITICWVAPNILLSSSRGADLLQWTLPKPMVQAKFVRHVHKDHWSVLFSIKAPILYLNEYNFLQKRDINAWTTGMDRAILNTDIESQKNLGCYYALGGSVNCFSGSPLDPNRLCFGTGEGIVNVWDLSREHKKRIVISTFYHKILASVTALSWHPLVETSLALGTIEGRIGILDTVAKAKSPKLLAQYFKSQIFKMEWGPLNGNMALFVVSESKVAIFDPKSKETTEPQLLEMPDNTTVYTMAWKPDYSLLLVASKTGSLITYTPDLKISTITYLKQKLQSIVWNPNAASNDASLSKYCQTFASIIKHSEFIVYDLGAQSENTDDKVMAHFENRGVIINSIEWNPHAAHQLVLVDDGGVAQVYDVEQKTVLSTYVNPWFDSLLSTYWSPVDPDYIITGTVGHKIVVWKVSEHAALTGTEINALRNKMIKAQSKEVGDQVEKRKLEVAAARGQTEAAKLKKSSLLPTFYTVKDQTIVQDTRKLLQWKLGDATVESNVGDTKCVDVLEIFDDKNTMERVLNLNIASFRHKGQHHYGNLLSLFKGDIGLAVKEAIDQKRVNPWIISMCPMVSPKLWQTACETYATQLRDEPEADPFEIVTYLLACHKVEESVEVLCERAMFKEALVLAKARFGAQSTVVFDIIQKWGKSSTFNGNLELAAQCYITLGKFEDAASALFRRSNVELLELALELAKLSGNEELEKAVTFRVNAFKTEDTGSLTMGKKNKDYNQHCSEQVRTETNGAKEVSDVESDLPNNVEEASLSNSINSAVPLVGTVRNESNEKTEEKTLDNENGELDNKVVNNDNQLSEEAESFDRAKQLGEDPIKEESEQIDEFKSETEVKEGSHTKVEGLENKMENVSEDKPASNPKDADNDAEVTRKVKELLLEGDKMCEVTEEVLKRQEGLLSSSEVKELLLKRKMSLEEEASVKEGKEE